MKVAIFIFLILFIGINYPDSPYLDIYKNSGKFLIIKITGELIYNGEFQNFVEYLKSLKNLGIPIILFYGGGTQIDREYKNSIGETIEKGENRLNLTNNLFSQKGITQDYKEIEKYLEEIFGLDNINIFKENDIVYDQISDSGAIGNINNFLELFSTDKINIIPFVGINNSTNNLSNTNEDEIINKFVYEFKDKISNIIFLTKNGGILNNNGSIISFLTLEKIESILQGTNNCVNIEGGMLENINSVYNLLKKGISKVVIASLSDLKEELEGFGSGTMIIDLSKAKFSKLLDRSMFEMIYSRNVKDNAWKERNQIEKDIIFNNYIVLEINGTILGGYSLSDYELDGKRGKLIECLFSFKIGNGIGRILGEEIKKSGTIFAYSKKREFFTKLGFKKIDGKKSETGSDLYLYNF